MAAFEALYQQDPFWVWIALACLSVAAGLASGRAEPMWPAVAAVAVGLAGVAGAPLGGGIDAALFVGLSVAALVAVRLRGTRKPRAAPSSEARSAEPARLVGRIGRASSEFFNGVGRVWIDGAEWGAELDEGEGAAKGAPLRVVRVIGGVRLQVQALDVG